MDIFIGLCLVLIVIGLVAPGPGDSEDHQELPGPSACVPAPPALAPIEPTPAPTTTKTPTLPPLVAPNSPPPVLTRARPESPLPASRNRTEGPIPVQRHSEEDQRLKGFVDVEQRIQDLRSGGAKGNEFYLATYKALSSAPGEGGRALFTKEQSFEMKALEARSREGEISAEDIRTTVFGAMDRQPGFAPSGTGGGESDAPQSSREMATSQTNLGSTASRDLPSDVQVRLKAYADSEADEKSQIALGLGADPQLSLRTFYQKVKQENAETTDGTRVIWDGYVDELSGRDSLVCTSKLGRGQAFMVSAVPEKVVSSIGRNLRKAGSSEKHGLLAAGIRYVTVLGIMRGTGEVRMPQGDFVRIPRLECLSIRSGF